MKKNPICLHRANSRGEVLRNVFVYHSAATFKCSLSKIISHFALFVFIIYISYARARDEGGKISQTSIINNFFLSLSLHSRELFNKQQ
jgi:hypothetical protein